MKIFLSVGQSIHHGSKKLATISSLDSLCHT